MNRRPYWLIPRPETKPHQCQASPRYVLISELPTDQKQRLWSGIKKHQPAMADMMQNDPFFKQLQAAFNASVVIDKNTVEELSK